MTYSLPKQLLLLFAILVSVIYALPNFYGEDAAVQISLKSGGAWKQTDTDQVYQALKNIDFVMHGVAIHANDMIIRFKDTNSQLRARDHISHFIGEGYTVALNLMPRTPAWLSQIGAAPMKLGLDLRGGVHFLLNVDIETVMKARQEGDVRTIGKLLREQQVRYKSIHIDQAGSLHIHLSSLADRKKAQSLLKQNFKDYHFVVMSSSQPEWVITAEMPDSVVDNIRDYVVDQTMTTLRNRVNELGLSEAVVQRQGRQHVNVYLPGIQDTARAKALIGKTATLRFQLVDTDHDVKAALAGDIPFGSRLYYYQQTHEGGRVQPVLLDNQTILQGSAITYATALYREGRPAVNIRLGGGGESLFHRVTQKNIGKPLAVVYVETRPEKKQVDGQLKIIHRQYERIISIATIQSALGNNFDITGLSSELYAQNLALLLRSGALAAPVDIVEELTVGPSLGKANIRKGMLSLGIGSLWVVIFMWVYYRLFGLIANLALLLNVVFIIAVLSILGATLTLPGIAGIVLTVGMAVDANVLINERIREELRLGMTPIASIQAGYGRAFATIVDANVTTLIVAVILFGLGSGSVKGFAITLIVGLLASMITAIFFTHMVVEWIYIRNGRRVGRLSIGV